MCGFSRDIPKYLYSFRVFLDFQSFRFEDSLQMYVLCGIVEENGYDYTPEVRPLNNYNLLKTNLESILSASKIPYELSEPLTDWNPISP